VEVEIKKKYFTEEEIKAAKNERSKKYYHNHKKEVKEYCKIHREEKINYLKNYQKINKEKLNIKNREYQKNHKEYLYLKAKERRNNRLKIDINFKLTCSLRGRLYHAIKENQKSGSAVEDLGCSISDLKVYLESKFQEGMSWKNWNRTGWHIDHIIPLASFNLQNREEFLKANHYTNLQPMWAEENIKKSNKVS
jgi:hypothetical protein